MGVGALPPRRLGHPRVISAEAVPAVPIENPGNPGRCIPNPVSVERGQGCFDASLGPAGGFRGEQSERIRASFGVRERALG